MAAKGAHQACLYLFLCVFAAVDAFYSPCLFSSRSLSRRANTNGAIHTHCQAVDTKKAAGMMGRRELLAGGIITGAALLPDRSVHAEMRPVKAPPGDLRNIVSFRECFRFRHFSRDTCIRGQDMGQAERSL